MAAPTRMAMIVVLNRGEFMLRFAQLPWDFNSSCLNCIFNYVDIKICKYNNYHRKFPIQKPIGKQDNMTPFISKYNTEIYGTAYYYHLSERGFLKDYHGMFEESVK